MKTKLTFTYKILSSLVLGLFLTVTLFGQRPEMREKIKEKIKVEKIGYITSELDLKSEEAVKFWPIYNEYEAKKEANRDQLESLYNLNTGNATTSLDKYLKLKEEEYLIEKTYIAKFQKILPPEKVLELITSEKRFKEELIKKVKQRMRREREN